MKKKAKAMKTNKKIFLILFSIFLGGFTNNASAISEINWSSPKIKTICWGGGAALSAVFGLYFLNQAQKCREVLDDPTLSEDERAAILGKSSRCYALAGACLAGTVFTGAMAVKNGIDWKNGKSGGGDSEEIEKLKRKHLREKGIVEQELDVTKQVVDKLNEKIGQLCQDAVARNFEYEEKERKLGEQKKAFDKRERVFKLYVSRLSTSIEEQERELTDLKIICGQKEAEIRRLENKEKKLKRERVEEIKEIDWKKEEKKE
jgi:hypothetical protein